MKARNAITPAVSKSLTRTAVRHPFAEQIDASLLPGTFSFRWWWRHDSAANPTNPIEDRGRMSLHVIITRQVECLAHPLNILVRKKRPDVSCEAGQLAHCASLLCLRRETSSSSTDPCRIDDKVGEAAVTGVHSGQHLVDLGQRRHAVLENRKIERSR